MSLEFYPSSVQETLQIAATLGESLCGGEVLALVGELGSGKTTFTRGLCQGLGVKDARAVSSPTYVLEHVYEARVPVRHYDAYRLESAAELLALGIDEQLAREQVLIIEWADKVLSALPADRLVIELEHVGGDDAATKRRMRISGPATVWGKKLEPLLKFSPPRGR